MLCRVGFETYSESLQPLRTSEFTMYRLFVLNSHPIQYFAPLYRHLNQEPDIDVTVLYCSRQGLESYKDEGFGGIEVEWDIPLLDGYKSVFLKNWSHKSTVGGLTSLINPGIIKVLARERPDALIVHGYSHATTLMAIGAAKLLGIPVLMRGDANPLDGRYANPHTPKNRLRQKNRELIFSLVSGCLAIGTRNCEFYLNHGVPSGRIFLAPFSVDNAYFREHMLLADKRSDFLIANGVKSDLPAILFAG